MAEVVVSSFKVDMVSAQALKVLKFAVTHAQKNRYIKQHTIQINAFCCSAGLPSHTVDEFSSLLKEACRASFVVETIDTASPDRDDLPFFSWVIFIAVCVDSSSVTFEICDRILEKELVMMLKNI